jgi:hypothetical protein
VARWSLQWGSGAQSGFPGGQARPPELCLLHVVLSCVVPSAARAVPAAFPRRASFCECWLRQRCEAEISAGIHFMQPSRFFWRLLAGATGVLAAATLGLCAWHRVPPLCGSNAELCSRGRCPLTWQDAQVGDRWCDQESFMKVVARKGCGTFNMLEVSGVDGRDVYYYDLRTLELVGSRTFAVGVSWCRGSVPLLDRQCEAERVVCDHRNP